VISIVDKIVTISRALNEQGIPHAFGGALALAWCTEQARGTVDIDVNVFVEPAATDAVLEALPAGIACTPENRNELVRDGQVRLWWETTPVDVFLNTTEFHTQVAVRAQDHLFNGANVPFLSCTDLTVFKAFFNRTKDWADIEAIVEMQTLDVDRVIGVLARHLGSDDERTTRFLGLVRPT
jgi:hypothetical protein